MPQLGPVRGNVAAAFTISPQNPGQSEVCFPRQRGNGFLHHEHRDRASDRLVLTSKSVQSVDGDTIRDATIAAEHYPRYAGSYPLSTLGSDDDAESFDERVGKIAVLHGGPGILANIARGRSAHKRPGVLNWSTKVPVIGCLPGR